MSFVDELGFDIDSLLQETPQPTPTPVAVTQARAVQKTTNLEVRDALSDVEKRLEKANCYKVLLTDGLFEEALPGTAAGEVQKEVRDFVRQRLELLLGMSKAPAQSQSEQQFNQVQILVLKAIANRVVASSEKAKQARVAVDAGEKLKQLVAEIPAEEEEPVAVRPTPSPKLRKPRQKASAKEPLVEAVEEKAVPVKRTVDVELPDGTIRKMSAPQVTSGVGHPPLTSKNVESAFSNLASSQAQALANNAGALNILSKIGG